MKKPVSLRSKTRTEVKRYPTIGAREFCDSRPLSVRLKGIVANITIGFWQFQKKEGVKPETHQVTNHVESDFTTPKERDGVKYLNLSHIRHSMYYVTTMLLHCYYFNLTGTLLVTVTNGNESKVLKAICNYLYTITNYVTNNGGRI